MMRETEGPAMQPETERTVMKARDERPLRRSYSRPRLEVLGDIRDLTLGGSPGVGDSGVENTEPPGL